eukprot:640000-Amphidinium_carterae.1
MDGGVVDIWAATAYRRSSFLNYCDCPCEEGRARVSLCVHTEESCVVRALTSEKLKGVRCLDSLELAKAQAPQLCCCVVSATLTLDFDI